MLLAVGVLFVVIWACCILQRMNLTLPVIVEAFPVYVVSDVWLRLGSVVVDLHLW
jgi:hypothetical protein